MDSNRGPPAAVNGAGTPTPPQAVPRKKKPAPSLFKPTNNQRNRYPLGAAPKPIPTSTNRAPNGTVQPNLQAAKAYTKVNEQQPVPTINSGPVKEYKLVTTKRELIDGLRYHLMQLGDKVKVDIRKEEDFPKPARLHRRNPDWKTFTKATEEDPSASKDAETDALNKRREARQKQREENLAQIAPSASANRRKLFTKKTAQAYHNDYTDEQKRRMQMNYEEKIPWVLEDFDNKHTLVGKHNQGSMGVYAAFAREQTTDGERFRLIPVEKFYMFDPHSTVQADLTWEQIEQQLKKNKKLADMMPDTIARKEEERSMAARREKEFKQSQKLYVHDRGVKFTREGEDADLDYEDDFADDEEGLVGDIFGDKDEDEKAAEKKKDEREIEEDEKKEDRAEKLVELYARDVRKKLEKYERRYDYLSGSDSDDSTDSEEERRLEAEKLANLKKDDDAAKSALSSGANTPSGRKEKHPASDRENGIKKSSSSRTLKRPGSPNLSDASGTDASTMRKKKKKSHHASSRQPTPGGSRPMSPDGVRRGAGSDTDGGAMSDGTRLKLKLKRPGSPSATNSPPRSRAGSPGPRYRNLDMGVDPFPAPEEFEARIPVEGLPTKEFLIMYKMPIEKEKKKEWSGYMQKYLKGTNGRIYTRRKLASSGGLPPATVAPAEQSTTG
ncbi:Transcription initiation factor IIF subunit alpha [Cyphellophora attinorum]|uniref:Transcription initiation factor IIF subunit alpha n=1 Tax=Cyphellophora attinorum TaxID=1664694 RepID=A0A0N0NHY4_9EURO|nr:Transcription initiation factor IIF subunit alpha [Phialophora attinorum]KPI34819.1 Transcription initiation factor IIF subunit alpha [Phialophora attinorum]